MSSKLVVSDAGPLIALAGIGQLQLLSELFDAVFLTAAVQQECLVDFSLPGAKAIHQALLSGLLTLHNPSKNAVMETVLGVLDAGENVNSISE